MTIIYKHTFSNGKSYIGQTVSSLEARLQRHITETRNGISDYKFNRALKKYKYDIKSEILEVVEETKANDREIYWIAYYDSFNKGYNSTVGGEGNQSPSQETKDKISNTINSKSEEQKEKVRIRAAIQVKKLWEDEEYRKQQSESHKGCNGLLNNNIKPVAIFDENENHLFTVLYEIEETLNVMGFPGSSLKQSLYNKKKLFMSTRRCDIEKIKKKNFYQYRGWYAKHDIKI